MEELKNRKMLGIIGGMGPEASCYFYENVTINIDFFVEMCNNIK